MHDDPEIKAMSDVSVALSGLDPEAISRVLKWAVDRYQVKGVTAAVSAAEERRSDPTDNRQFEDLPSLYDAANPQSGPDRALVVAYWLQVIQNQPDFDGFSVNRELKHLGHPSTNITRDLDGLIDRKPRLVMQVRKSGSSKQARKRYKVTVEGARAVERMLAGERIESN